MSKSKLAKNLCKEKAKKERRKKARKLCAEIASELWVEAVLDPYDDYMAKWAPPILEKVRKLNKLI